MRRIDNIVIHCAATQPEATVEAIQNYWRNNLKWKNPGYHYLIRKDGTTAILADHETICNGVEGHNKNSIHVSYIGGVDKDNKTPKDTRTADQLWTMRGIVLALKAQYPNAKILGHRDFSGVKKACPSFDVAEWLKKEGI